MTLTLSQRLTRAGLTFVLLGTVAAVLPQESGQVNAADCTVTGGGTLRLAITTSGATVTPDPSTMTPTATKTFVDYKANGASSFTNVTATAASLSVTSGVLVASGVACVSPNTITAPASNTGNTFDLTKSYSVRLTQTVGDKDTSNKNQMSTTGTNSNTGTLRISYQPSSSEPTYIATLGLQGP